MPASKVSYHARAVVTGAGSGIGRAFALEIHRRGGSVVCADIHLESAQATAQLINGEGGKALAAHCDVANLEDMQALSATCQQWFAGSPNLLINNAGVGLGGKRVEDIAIADWQWIMGINLWGVIHGCHVFVPGIKQLGRGGIINVSSAASFGSAPMMGAYNATKAAVVAISETLHAEMAGLGIHVSVLCPTFVKTNVIQNARLTSVAGANGLSIMVRDKAQALMNRFGHSPESVVTKALDGLDNNEAHVLPQLDARIAWRLKRVTPAGFLRLNGVMSRRLNS